MHDLTIIGAGPAGIALAVQAGAAGVDPERTLILEKSASHCATIRQLYPEHKLTTATYKGFAASRDGLVHIGDMSKAATLAYFDRVIAHHRIRVRYHAEVFAMRRLDSASGARFRVESSIGAYDTRALGVAIGIFGRPKKPTEYRLPTLKDRIVFDVASAGIANEGVLVVGGGDSAAEYAEALQRAGNRVTLSYRGREFHRVTPRNRAVIDALGASGAIEILLGSNLAQVGVDGGRPLVTFQESPDRPRRFERIVYALGGTTPTSFLRMLGIDFDASGPVVGESGETAIPGLFLLGDIVFGRAGGSINTACNSAAATMRRIAATGLLPLAGPAAAGLVA